MTRLLRLGVLFNRGRIPIELPPIDIDFDDPQQMILTISAEWLENHPLTAADLRQEVDLLAAAGYDLLLAEA